uniref:Uncharacterized protein n=1 Tax=Anguilla anguilla TaxID=7936 RepID=A0A0E9SYQ2_ANGAN
MGIAYNYSLLYNQYVQFQSTLSTMKNELSDSMKINLWDTLLPVFYS